MRPSQQNLLRPGKICHLRFTLAIFTFVLGWRSFGLVASRVSEEELALDWTHLLSRRWSLDWVGDWEGDSRATRWYEPSSSMKAAGLGGGKVGLRHLGRWSAAPPPAVAAAATLAPGPDLHHPTLILPPPPATHHQALTHRYTRPRHQR